MMSDTLAAVRARGGAGYADWRRSHGRQSVLAAPASSAHTSADRSLAYVAEYWGNSVTVMDTATSKVTGKPICLGGPPVAITPDGKTAYVVTTGDDASGGTATVSVIDSVTGTVKGTPIPWVTASGGIAITPDGKTAYVTNFGSGIGKRPRHLHRDCHRYRQGHAHPRG